MTASRILSAKFAVSKLEDVERIVRGQIFVCCSRYRSGCFKLDMSMQMLVENYMVRNVFTCRIGGENGKGLVNIVPGFDLSTQIVTTDATSHLYSIHAPKYF